jgi:hypothetical protein
VAFLSDDHARQLAATYRGAQDRVWEARRKMEEHEDALKGLRESARMREQAHKAAHEAFSKAFDPLYEGEGEIDGKHYRFPHCDSYVLHKPGACRYCDAFPARQKKRQDLGVAFTGETPTEGQIACPSELLRPASVIHRWPGNRPTEDDGDEAPIDVRKINGG